jgi:hypothetical protein
VGSTVALVAPRLWGATGVAALLTLPALALALPTLRWRAARSGGRDRASSLVAGAAIILAAASLLALAADAPFVAGWLAAPATATLGLLGLPASLAVGTLCLAGALALVASTIARQGGDLPPVVLRQSLVLGELRAIASLRLMAMMTMTELDPGGRFAAARLRDALRGAPTATSPRWRPGLPRVGGATTAFAWLGIVRAWRASPVTPLLVLPMAAAAALAIPVGGPYGGAALVPSLALAWVAAQLHPGRVPWPGYAVDGRGRTMAALLLVTVPAWVALVLVGLGRALLGFPPVDDWLLVPLALAAGALVDLIGARSPDVRGAGVWLAAGVLVAAPGAILGWAGTDPGVAASIAAAIWGGAAWLRVLAAPSVG